MLSNKELKKLEMWKRVIDHDRFRTPLIEEFTDGFEFEKVSNWNPEYDNTGTLLSKGLTWRFGKINSPWDINEKFIQSFLDNKEIRIKKEIPTNRLKTWSKEIPLRFLQSEWTKNEYDCRIQYDKDVRITKRLEIITFPNNTYYINGLKVYDVEDFSTEEWFNWKYFEGVYVGSEQDFIKETNLNHLDKLQKQVTKAHMKKPNKKPLPDKPAIIKYKNIQERKKKKRSEHRKLAEKNRQAQMKLYNPAKGNRKQRRKKIYKTNWGQPGSRFAKLQLIPIKKKNEKVIYKDGKNILLSTKGIPLGEPIETTIIEPNFMYVPFIKTYHKHVTIDGEIRKIKTGQNTVIKKFLTGHTTWDITREITRYIPVEYKTITQYLYPTHLCRQIIKNKERLKELQKQMAKIQKEQKKKDKEKKLHNKPQKQKTTTKRSKQKKGN